jgi:hypothetical protein
MKAKCKKIKDPAKRDECFSTAKIFYIGANVRTLRETCQVAISLLTLLNESLDGRVSGVPGRAARGVRVRPAGEGGAGHARAARVLPRGERRYGGTRGRGDRCAAQEVQGPGAHHVPAAAEKVPQGAQGRPDPNKTNFMDDILKTAGDDLPPPKNKKQKKRKAVEKDVPVDEHEEL